jgi:zinc protease
LSLLAEVVRTPAFDAKTFERVRAEWIDGLTAERQSVERLATLAGLRTLLGARLGEPVDGSVPDVRALGLADVIRFHRTRVGPSRTALVVVGDISVKDGKSAAESAFGDWRQVAQTPPSAAPQPAAPAATQVLLVDRPGAVQSALFVAQPFPKRGEPGHEARELLSGVMGGLFTSRINKNLREEHAYTYGARSTVLSTRELGAFVVTTSVQRDVTAPALVELLGELRAPAKDRPVGRDEVERAKADRVSHLGAHLEHVDRLATDLTELFEEQLERDHFAKLPAEIQALSTADVARQAERLTPDHLVVVVVGDAAAVRPALEKSFEVHAAPAGALD